MGVSDEYMLDKLDFCSIFSYCPRNESDEGLRAIKLMTYIKNDWPMGVGLPPASKCIAKVVKNLVRKGYFLNFFQQDIALVPIPRAAEIKKGWLWPSFQIAKAMEDEALGTLKPVLVRVKTVHKSSLQPPNQRPKPKDHYETIIIDKTVKLDSRKVLLVDDIVTRGHTLMGSAWRLKKEFQDVEIKAFAAMMTISNPLKFEKCYNPVEGRILYRHEKEDCLRREEKIPIV